MTGAPVVEARIRRRWLLFALIAVPALGAVMVAGAIAILAAGGPLVVRLLVALAMVAVLGGLVVVPGFFWLLHRFRGALEVRIDDTGIVFGNDRRVDPAIAWSAIERVTVRAASMNYGSDRILLVEPRAGAWSSAGLPVRTRWGLTLNGSIYGAPLAISTSTLDVPYETIVAAVEAHLGRPIEDWPGEPRR